MKIKLAKKFMAMFFTLCMMISLVPVKISAAEGDTTNIEEINITDVSGELWSNQDVKFAKIDESSNYTIESQKWYSSESEQITPSSAKLKPKAGESYSLIINFTAKDGYVFPIKSESNTFYNGIFKVNGAQCDTAVTAVTSDMKNLTATLFSLTKVKGVTDIPGGGNTIVKTTVNDNYTDCQVTDDINLRKNSDYIIDFTKEDNLSIALRSMADLEGTKYYKFANSDNNSLIETEDVSEALIKIVGNKSENKAIMTLISDIDTDISYTLKFIRTQYTGSKLTYKEDTVRDEETGKNVIKEIRDDYYTRYHFDCQLNLIAYTPDYNVIEGTNSSWVQNSEGTLTFRADGDFSKFAGIKIDDEWVEPENYTAVSGSTVVTLKNKYLQTLSADEHKLTFAYTDGEVSTNFAIEESNEIYENSNNNDLEELEKDSNNPKTGDNSNMILWISLLVVSVLAILGMIIYSRKKKNRV